MSGHGADAVPVSSPDPVPSSRGGTPVPPPLPPRLRIGVSACLLGEEVRHDGGHKRDTLLLSLLGPHVDWVPVCPESEVGMGTPREAVRLVGDAASPRMVGVRSGKDWTDAMHAFAAARLALFAKPPDEGGLHGFVLKKDSPSCGAFRVKVYGAGGAPSRDGRGLFAAALAERFPLLPVEEEGRLHDARLRENFLDRVFAHERWTRHVAADRTKRGLVRFHTIHKLTLLSHAPEHYRTLGRLVAGTPRLPLPELLEEYGRTFLRAIAVPSTPGRHRNVLQHLAGFLKDLPDDDRAELHTAIDDHRGGLVPLVVPVTLLRHHLRRAPDAAWALSQTYLAPYPKELMLRNHV